MENQVWEISYGKPDYPVLQGCTPYVLSAYTKKISVQVEGKAGWGWCQSRAALGLKSGLRAAH